MGLIHLKEVIMISKFSFERTELRVLQNECNGDNEKFLNILADIIGNLTVERNCFKERAHLAEGQLLEVRGKT